MTWELIGYSTVGVLAAGYLTFSLGVRWGKSQQDKNLAPLVDTTHSYRMAVDNVDKWCAHTSPHAKLIAAHIKAHGEGEGYNEGTPNKDEPCSISGLREQLKRLDESIAKGK